MRLPKIDKLPAPGWPESTFQAWQALEEKVSRKSTTIGKGGAFQKLVTLIKSCSRRGKELPVEVYQSRPGARALTWLWLQSEAIRNSYLDQESLKALLSAQAERLSRMVVLQLVQLYFREHDHLSVGEKGLTEFLGTILSQQIAEIQSRTSIQGRDIIAFIHRDDWLVGNGGPARLVEKCLETGLPLDEFVSRLGLDGYMDGRFGEVSRAIYYIDELGKIPVGKKHAVLNELVKDRVAKAPYQGNLRVGHAALKVLIDRTEGEPSELWQDVILMIAGDPRVSGSNRQFAEWWSPLGDDRVNKVRGWLAKEDLKLFLEAVEQYGLESDDESLNNMFPARKQFLQGLFKQGVVRNSRLMLGSKAEFFVRRILDKEMLSSYARMDGPMSDKAVIYLDCGDFHIVEGSHSFKIWIYQERPDPSLANYEKNYYTHSDLTITLPWQYRKDHKKKRYAAITHHPTTWRKKVLEFLVDHDIELEWPSLFGKGEWKSYKNQHGIPIKDARRLRDYEGG
ncbi:EH signature domain-containing protein [Alloalcanivorax profundimaris]|nr:EH signature domain-containing protein [Alloalcanivorax profundimaris]UWN48586.1 hypothetical protein ASALC70_00771 [Alcanivorax sp. ALC70]